MEEQGGGPQEMAFVRAVAGWFRAKTRAGQAQGRPPHHNPPSGQRAPPLTYQPRFTGSLSSCPGTWKPSLPPRGLRVFPWTTLPSRSPTPAEAECPGKTWGPGAGAVGPPRFCARWSRPGWAGPTPTDRFSRGEAGLRSAGAAKSLAWAETHPPCSVAANVD